jgi:peptidoglycan/xylan/chitin deacetylase (PgdA/CDA1 family)
MFTFRRLTVLFFLILMGLNLWSIFTSKSGVGLIQSHPTLLYSLLFSFYFGISFAMAFLPCSGFHHETICRGKTDRKIVALTFDDGPDNLNTPQILEVLARHKVPATFFCIGSRIHGNEELIRRIDTSGHILGNHSFSHSKFFDLFPAKKIRNELLETDRLIMSATGKSPLFFRPPYGVINPLVSSAVKGMHWKLICWNIRSFDTLNAKPEKTKNRILSRLKPGSIILLHDHSVMAETTLEELILAIRQQGYEIVPLDNLLNIPAYAS